MLAWSAHAAAESSRATASTVWAKVTGSASCPPSERGRSIRKRPASRRAAIAGAASRRPVSVSEACSRSTGPISDATRGSVWTASVIGCVAISVLPRYVLDDR